MNIVTLVATTLVTMITIKTVTITAVTMVMVIVITNTMTMVKIISGMMTSVCNENKVAVTSVVTLAMIKVPKCIRTISSVHFKVVVMRSEKPICAPPRLSEVSLTSPLKRFQRSSDYYDLLSSFQRKIV